MKMQFSYSVFVYFFIIGAGGFCLLASLASQPKAPPGLPTSVSFLPPASISTQVFSAEPTFAAGGKSETVLLADPTVEPDLSPADAEERQVDPACVLAASVGDLLTLVDKEHGLGRDDVPPDLVALDLHSFNTYVLPMYLRAAAGPPLLKMLRTMNEAGLRPKVISAYRSYVEQGVAYDKWLRLHPDRAGQISAAPGYSEHQLGTAVDFGAPSLDNRFHTNFYYTPEGQWLDRHAVEYGFTLSYPEWSVEQTGYEWEPWHWRYVGTALAQELQARRLTLSAYLAGCAPWVKPEKQHPETKVSGCCFSENFTLYP